MSIHRLFGIIACGSGFTAVALGAFGAHALKEALVAAGTLEVWKTAVDYQFWHALALLLCALVRNGGPAGSTAGMLFTIGSLVFSGSLYGLALGGPGWLGPITPIGGLSLMGGWAALAVAFWRKR
ncbi:MAG: DUF423 domain-containing protein [Opitutales bacterium]